MTRLILAGTDPEPLEALAVTLWNRRKSLVIEVYDEHIEAAEAILNGQVDVLACDLSDGTDHGEALLSLAKRSAPTAVRVALASASDPNVVFRAVRLAHRTLFRPWNPRNFSRMITRLIDMRDSFMLDHCQIAFGTLNQIPPVPTVYAQLIAKFGAAEVDIARVASVIERDAHLTQALLRVTNSALFGLDREITSAHDAVLYLGLRTVRDIVLSNEAVNLFNRVGADDILQLKRLRRTASIVSRVAEALGERRRCRESAFLAGLMHILGFVSSNAPDEDPEVAAELGGYLLGLWGLPERVVHAVSKHVAPSKSDLNQPVAACLFLATQLTGRVQPDAPIPDTLTINHAMHTVGISDADFPDLRSIYPRIRRP